MSTENRDTNLPRDHPEEIKFYSIIPQEDGTVDVYLSPETPRRIKVVKGIVPWDGIEEDIRRRYSSWCFVGEDTEI